MSGEGGRVGADSVDRYRSALVFAGFSAGIPGGALHWPDSVRASSLHFSLTGLPFSPLMVVGMALIGLGLVLSAVGLALPALRFGEGLSCRVQSMDERRLNRADLGL